MADYVTREEVDGAVVAVQSKYEQFARRTFRILAVYSVALLITAFAAGYGIKQNFDQTNQIQANLIENCQTNGNPIRLAGAKFGEVIANQKQTEVDQTKAFVESGLFQRAFQGLSRDEIHEIVSTGRERDLKEKAEIEEAAAALHPVNCRAAYSQ
jgi:hypothetical protein